MTLLRLAACTVDLQPGHVITTLPDGATIHGVPHYDDAAYLATARRLGYGDDIERLNRCHEVAHSLLADLLELKSSPVMQRVAAGEHEPTDITGAEESAVMALEVYANALGLDLATVAMLRGWK